MPRWESPDPRKILITGARLADELGISPARANDIARSLEQVFIGDTHTHYRVTRRSVDRLQEFLEMGLTLKQARVVMWEYKKVGLFPTIESGEAALKAVSQGSRFVDAYERAVQRRMDYGQTRKSANHWVRKNHEWKHFYVEEDAIDTRFGVEWIQGRDLWARRTYRGRPRRR